MISASNRLPLRSQPTFFRNSFKVERPFGTVFIQKNSLRKTRCAVIVPKKTVGLATHRNRIKRATLPLLVLASGDQNSFDIAVRVKNRKILDDKNTFFIELKSILNQARSAL